MHRLCTVSSRNLTEASGVADSSRRRTVGTGFNPHNRPSPEIVSTECLHSLVDHFSKWSEAISIPNHTAATVAKVLMVNVFTRFGMPAEILSDRCTEFESELFSQLLMARSRQASAKSCRLTELSRGSTERSMRFWESSCRHVKETWGERLPYALMAYRATIHSSTGFTPN